MRNGDVLRVRALVQPETRTSKLINRVGVKWPSSGERGHLVVHEFKNWLS